MPTLSVFSLAGPLVYLIDTNVISEIRKKSRANAGVIKLFEQVRDGLTPIYLSAVTIGELRRGVELIKYRGDIGHAKLLENWLDELLYSYSGKILEFDSLVAQVWGRLRVPNPENPIDKQIAFVLNPQRAQYRQLGVLEGHRLCIQLCKVLVCAF